MSVRWQLTVLTLGILWLGKLLNRAPDTPHMRNLLLGAYLLLALVWLTVLWLTPRAEFTTALGPWRPGWLLPTIASGAVLFIIAGFGYVLSARLGLSPPPEATSTARADPLFLCLTAVLVIVLALIEEWLFRDVLYQAIATHSTILAVCGSSLAFSVYHLSPFQLLPTFLLGLGLALLVAFSGALWPAMLAHALFNLLGVAALISQK